MLACPQCGDPASIRIDRDPDRPSDRGRARWRLRCGACGAAWSMTDDA